VDVYEIGVYGRSERAVARPKVLSPRPHPLLAALDPWRFSGEARRRRKRARQLLVARGKSPLAARLYGQRVVKRGVKHLARSAAWTQGFLELATDLLAPLCLLSLSLLRRLLAISVRLLRTFARLYDASLTRRAARHRPLDTLPSAA